MVPGYKAYQSFISELQESDEQVMTYDSQLITDDEKSESEEQSISGKDNEQGVIQKFTDFNLEGEITKEAPVAIIEDEEDRPMENHAAEFLKIHHQLGHVSPKVIQIMAKQGLLPSKLKDAPVPLCTSCMFGKATKPSMAK
jgi:GAG-pre-integrase domain